MDQSSSITVHARRWSESVLELPEESGSRTVLRRLTEADYFASVDDANAMQLLLSPESTTLPKDAIGAADFCGRREDVARALAGYTEEFFDLAPVQRHQQWHTLAAEAADFPDLQDWLHRLEPALVIAKVLPTGVNSIDRFVDLCCQSFVARAPWHTRQRQAIAHMYCQDHQLWEQVVQHLIDCHPAFINAVAPWVYWLHELNLAELTKNDLVNHRKVIAKESPQEGAGRFAWIFVVSIIFAVIRAIARFDPPPPPRYSDDPFATRPSGAGRNLQTDRQDENEPPKRRRLMDEDIRRMLMQYESEKLQKESDAALEGPADALTPDQPRN